MEFSDGVMEPAGLRSVHLLRAQAGEWEAPFPLEDVLPMAWPDGVFSGDLAEFVREVARFTQTPVDFSGMLTLAALSVCWGGKVRAEIYPGYREHLMLYVVIAATTGERKSAVYERIEAPIREHERAGHKDLVLVDDATPQALEVLMAETGGRAAIFGPEGGALFEQLAGTPGSRRAASATIYLKGYTAEAHAVRRIGRGAQLIEHPALTIGIMTQPTAFRALSNKEELLNRGLIGRILFSCPAQSQVGYLKARVEPVPAPLVASYHQTLSALLALPLCDPLPVCRFSPQALHEYERYFDEIEARRRPTGDLARLAEWVNKLRGNMMRVATLLHLTDQMQQVQQVQQPGAEAPWEVPVSGEAVERAVRLSEYLISHARAAFGLMDESTDVARARRLLRWVREGRRVVFTAREAQRYLAKVGPRQKVLDPVLQVLLSHGYVRVEHRNKREIYQVSPHEVQRWTGAARP